MKLPPLIVAVTGSNGKTSTTEYIAELAKKTGRTVITNYEGSNQTEGIVTLFIKNATLSGRVRADIAIIESDERYCQYTFSFFTPQCIVVTNLFRDQMTRNGHNEYVFDELKKGLPVRATLILNADDPLSSALASGREDVIYFGIDPHIFGEEEREPVGNDGSFCPVCTGVMKYSSRMMYHLGWYYCSSCGYARKKTKHSVTSLINDMIVIDGIYDVKPQMLNAMFASNVLAAFTVGVEVFKLSEETAGETLNGYILKNDRVVRFISGGHRGMFMLAKHENTMAYNMTLRTIVKSRSKAKTVVIIFDQLSRKYTANDISWLWDVDFELLKDECIKVIAVSGAFAYDLAVRLLAAGIGEDTIKIIPDIKTMTDSLPDIAVGEIFAMTCFTDVRKFMGRIERQRKV